MKECERLNHKLLKMALVNLGLREIDSEIYLFLAKEGPQKGRAIGDSLNLYKQNLYRSLKRLQERGIVSSTLERPASFSAVPFEKVLGFVIAVKKEQAIALQKRKDELLSTWRSTVGKQSEKS